MHCNRSRHVKSQILSKNKNYTWFYCHNCSLIYCNKKNKNHTEYKNRLKIFDDFKDANLHEFKSILHITRKYINLDKKDLSWLDYGCGSGTLLREINKITKNIIGFEPNIELQKKARNSRYKVFNEFSKIKKNKKFDVIFSRNTFKYIDNFPTIIKKISLKIKLNGLFIWRDKYFNFYPLSAMKNENLDNDHESMCTGSYLNKNTIFYHLNNNKFNVIYSKFYLDNSFFIIAKKNNKVINYKVKKFHLDLFLFKNQSILKIIDFTRKILFFLKKDLNLFC